jgi:UTP--glucose-1-phosphate uridylyltransferase
MENIQKAVIPAAGSGTRMSPVTDYLPKSMLPLGKKPVMHHLVDELREASIDKIAIVCQSNQTSIFSYFMNYSEVEFIIDDSKSGPGGALLKAQEFVDSNSFVTLFADAPIMGENRGSYLKALINMRLTEEATVALAVYQVPETEVDHRGVVTFKNNSITSGANEVAGIMEKPTKGEIKSDRIWASACRYVLDPKIFEVLGAIQRDEKNELQLTTAIRQLLQEGEKVIGTPLPDGLKRYDTGHFEGYFEAFKEFAEEASD